MMDMNQIKLEKAKNLSLKLEKECLLQKNCEIFIKEKKMISQQQCLKTENYEDDFTTSSDENNSLSTAFSPLLSENQSDIRMESSSRISQVLKFASEEQSDNQFESQEIGEENEDLIKSYQQKNIGDFVHDILNCKDKKRNQIPTKTSLKIRKIPLLTQKQSNKTKKNNQKSQKVSTNDNENNSQNLEKQENNFQEKNKCIQYQNTDDNNQRQQEEFVQKNQKLQMVKKNIKKVTNGFSFKKVNKSENLKLKHWTPEEENLFFMLLGKFGLDFNLLEHYIQNKNRKQIMMKYNREDKQNPEKIDLALKNQLFSEKQGELESIYQEQHYKLLQQQKQLQEQEQLKLQLNQQEQLQLQQLQKQQNQYQEQEQNKLYFLEQILQ